MAMHDSFRLMTNTSQNIASVAGTSTPCANPFGVVTLWIRVVATAAVNIRIDSGTPTALTTDTQLVANYPECFTVMPGQKLAAIGGPASVNITELT
jgi:hypothetical protein